MWTEYLIVVLLLVTLLAMVSAAVPSPLLSPKCKRVLPLGRLRIIRWTAKSCRRHKGWFQRHHGITCLAWEIGDHWEVTWRKKKFAFSQPLGGA